MASVRRLVGKTPFLRALRFTTKRPHVSRLTRPTKEAFFEFPTEVQEKLRAQVAGLESRTHPVKSLPRLKTMETTLEEFKKYHGKRPTHSQAAAALAMQHGLSGKELKPKVDAMISLDIRAKKLGKPLLADENKLSSSAVGKNALAKVSGALSKISKPVSVGELAARTGLDKPVANQALIILAEMRMATQMPKTAGQKTTAYSWIGTEKRLLPATKPVQNSAYNVLLALESGPKSKTELYSPTKFFDTTLGSGKLRKWQVSLAIPLLEKQGLIECHSKRVETKNHSIRFYNLTQLGERLLKAQKARTSIHPELRTALVGQPFTGLMPSQARMLQKIVAYISIRDAYRKAPRKKWVQRGFLIGLMKKHSITRTKLSKILHGSRQPWKQVSFQELRHIYLPEMYKIAPVEARWFEKYLSEHEAEFKQGKRKPRQFVSPTEIFEKNKHLARSTLNKFWKARNVAFQRAGISYEDLLQESFWEMQKAAEAYSLEQKGAFSTLAATYINNRLKSILTEKYAQKRTPTRVVSMDKGGGKTGEPLAAQIQAPKPRHLEDAGVRNALIGMINDLDISKRNKDRVIKYFGLKSGRPKTFPQIAAEEGRAPQAIQASVSKALEELRKNPKIAQFKELI